MTHDGRRSYSRNSNRIVRCLLGWTVGVVLATGPVEAGPLDQTTTNASVAAGARQSSSFSERRARWLAMSRSLDPRKWDRIWLCMQFKDAPMDFADALNICEPCISALATAGVRPAVLTDREKSCINRRTGDGGGADAGVGAGKYDAAVNPQCSGTNPIGARTDENVVNTTRPTTRAELAAQRDVARAEAELREASEGVLKAEARLERAERDARRHPSRENTQHRDDAIDALAAARALEREAAERLVAAERRRERAYDQAEDDWWERRRDPAVGPAGERTPGGGDEDPRCQGQRQAAAWGAPWSDVCRGEDGHLVDFKECHRRMTDPVYAVSGGRCWEEPGQADGVKKVCREQDAGRQEPGNTPGGEVNPGPVDPAPWKRPNASGAGAGPVPNPVQPLRDQMCAKGRCPDPLPFNAAVPQTSNGNSRWSNSVPPGQGLSLDRTQRPAPSTGTMLRPTASTGMVQRPTASTSMTQTPMPSTGMMHKPMPSAGTTQRPTPSTGMTYKPMPSTGMMYKPMPSTGMTQRPAARVGAMQGQVPSAVTTRPNQLRQTPSLKVGSFNAASAAKPGLNGLRAPH